MALHYMYINPPTTPGSLKQWKEHNKSSKTETCGKKHLNDMIQKNQVILTNCRLCVLKGEVSVGVLQTEAEKKVVQHILLETKGKNKL